MDLSIIFKMAVIGIIITVICQILKKSERDDVASIVAIAGLIIVLTLVIGMIAVDDRRSNLLRVSGGIKSF